MRRQFIAYGRLGSLQASGRRARPTRATAQPLEDRRLLSTWYVDHDALAGAANGSSWFDAFADLQTILPFATPGDVIRIAQGTYKPTTDTNRAAAFVLKSGVSLYGGYAGLGAANPNQRDPSLYPTILSGQIGGLSSDGDNSYHILVASQTDATAVLDGFTITAGNANGSSSARYGGGMYNSSGSPTVANCTFIANRASSNGGAVYNAAASPSFFGCTFTDNQTAASGGAMYNASSSSPQIVTCLFAGNSAKYGGGIANSSASPGITNCAFTQNSASSAGGGVYCSSAFPDIANCTFTRNGATNGGGVYCTSSSPTLSNCAFTGNQASSSGGGAYCTSSSSPTVTNCTFIANSATVSGGATYTHSSSPRITGGLFLGNSAGQTGGAMANQGFSVPSASNCTFAANSATQQGGAVYNSSSPSITNCILWDNTAADGPQVFNTSGSPTITFCDIQGWSSGGTGNVSANPLFLRPPSPGADGIWATSDDDYGDLHLRRASPAMDAGANAAVPAGVTTDLSGNPRFVDIPSVIDTGNGAGPIVDMGAYEAAPIPIYVDDTAGGANDGSSWANALTNLQSALTMALPGDQIWVAAGTYRPTADGDRTSTFQLVGGVAIYGAFPDGGGILSQRNVTAHATILSGDIGIPADAADNTYHVVTADWTDSATLLDGFVITAGNANGSASDDCGGGLHIASSNATIANCTFTANTASSQGGAVYGTGGQSIWPTFNNCLLEDNSAAEGGGAYYCYGPAAFIDCTFRRNTAVSGGGLNNFKADASIVGCTFIGNAASDSGGAMRNYSCAPNIIASSFLANWAGGGGGGVCSDRAPTILNGCVLVGNRADYGGGAYNYYCAPAIVGCTISGNFAGSWGGGVYNNTSSPAPSLANCIVWANSAGGQGAQVYNSPSCTATVTFSTVLGGYAGSGNITADPQFVSNPSPGADGVWGSADDYFGDLHLRLSSPAIDAGANPAVPSQTTTDLDGNPRRIDIAAAPNTGSGTLPIVDMGAYEAQVPDRTIYGGSGDDDYYARSSPDGQFLLVWTNSTASGQAAYEYPLGPLNSLAFQPGDGNNTLTIDLGNANPIPAGGLLFGDATGGNSLVLTGTNSASGITANAGQVLLGTGAVTLTNVGQVALESPPGQPVFLDLLAIGDGAIVTMPAGKVLRTNALTISGSGILDLGDGSLIVEAQAPSPTPDAVTGAIGNYIRLGRIITASPPPSGRILAAVLNDDGAGHTLWDTFAGQSALTTRSIVLRPTLIADADFNEVVDGDDYFRIDAGLMRGLGGFQNGDFNQDGVTDADDYFIIDAALISHAGSPGHFLPGPPIS